MKVNDGLGEWLTFVMIVISSNRKDMGAVIGLGRFKDEFVRIIAKGKDAIHLSCSVIPMNIINVGCEKEFHA